MLKLRMNKLFFIKFNDNEYNVLINLNKNKNNQDIIQSLKKDILKENPQLKNTLIYFTIYNDTKLATNRIINEKIISEDISKPIELICYSKLNGGVGIAMFGLIVLPMIIIGKKMLRLIEVIAKFFILIGKVFMIIPVVFDPPKLIDDIMFAVTYSINTIFSAAIESVRGSGEGEDYNAPDPNKESGTFGISQSKQNSTTCMDPTYSTIFLLLICPPLAIFYKLGFLRGFISSIICAVLCVKLYYFPGVLFAALHVLC